MLVSDVGETFSSSSSGGDKYPEVRFLNYKDRKRILITGGSGFVGSHLVDKLMLQGHEVIVADNFFTGR
jgi:UDP-glucuronate decarboxylase